MKELVYCILFIVLFIPLSNAQIIGVGITEKLEGKVTSMSYDPNVSNVFNIKIEFTNTGSVAYRARARLDIFDENNLLFIGWSSEGDFKPGSMKIFLIHWNPFNPGNFTGRLRIYYANEMIELDPLELNVLETQKSENVFEIQDFKTHDDEIEFSFKSNKALDDVVIIPSRYPKGWIFEQKFIEKINENDLNRINLPYKPSLWSPSEVTVEIVTEDGKYHTSKTFLMEKEKSTFNFISYFIKIIRIFSILPLV